MLVYMFAWENKQAIVDKNSLIDMKKKDHPGRFIGWRKLFMHMLFLYSFTMILIIMTRVNFEETNVNNMNARRSMNNRTNINTTTNPNLNWDT